MIALGEPLEGLPVEGSHRMDFRDVIAAPEAERPAGRGGAKALPSHHLPPD
jgi:hypothetical protein